MAKLVPHVSDGNSLTYRDGEGAWGRVGEREGERRSVERGEVLPFFGETKECREHTRKLKRCPHVNNPRVPSSFKLNIATSEHPDYHGNTDCSLRNYHDLA